ncbi:MAG: S8 family serine peptidase, partial [Halovenus sp.]
MKLRYKPVILILAVLFLQLFLIAGSGGEIVEANNNSQIEVQDTADVEIDDNLIDQQGEVTIVIRLSEASKSLNDQGLSSPDIEQLRDHAESTQANVEQFANDHAGIDIENQFWLTNAVVATVDTETITLDQLALIKGVEKIHADFEVEAESASASVSPSLSSDTVSTEEDTTYGLDQINASEAWSQYNTRGEGVKVAVLDTGVDAAHDDIDLYTDDSTDPTYPGGWAEFDSSGDQVAGSEPHDTDTHGTHVSGTVAGGNAAGTYIGVAPETNLMHGLVMPDNGGSFSQIIGGMEWAVENDADVISMSLGADGYYSSFIDPIRTAESQGVVVIASIGNDGEGTSSSPGNEYDS